MKILRLLRDLFHQETLILVLLLAVAVGGLCFVTVADKVEDRDSQAFDEFVLRSLRRDSDLRIPIGPSWVAAAARDISALGGATVLTLVTLGTAGFLYCMGKRRAMWLLAGATVGGSVIIVGLKELFARVRPSVVAHLEVVTSPSFPSGHSMLSTVVYLTLGAMTARALAPLSARVYVVAASVVLALLVGISRAFLGVHYPTDILGGWAAGLAWAILCWLVVAALPRSEPPIRVDPPGKPSTPKPPRTHS